MSVDRDVRADVADVLVRYATGIDRRDWDALRSCFTDDCQADYGPIGRWDSGAEITEFMRDAHATAGPTLHRITNVVVEEAGDGVRARCYVDALVMFADQPAGTRATGTYDDELVRTGEGWRIARRRFTPVLLQLVPDGTVIDLEARLAAD